MNVVNENGSPRLLDRLDEIDATWLTQALIAAGYSTAKVIGFTMTPIGNGNVSDTVRVELSYADEVSGPSSIVCKFRSQGEESHAHGISSGSYYREVGSYRVIGQSCRTPQLFWLDGGHDNINLVMEDLSGEARAGDQIAGCDADDAYAVIVELAKLHRSFFPMSADQAPEWAMTMAETADYWVAAIDRAMPVISDQVASRLTPAERDIVAGAHEIAGRWYRLPVPSGTLTHGDPRVDNILFLDGVGTQDKVQAVLIDWQLTGWRNPMHDVGYFLSGSVTIDDRREHEKTLLSFYADAFGPAYPLENIIADYRVQLLSGLMTTIASYGLLPLNPSYDKLLITLMHRNLAAASDWGSIEAVRELASRHA